MIAETANRVEQHTAPQILNDIRWRMQQSLDHYSHHPEQIAQRLDELDREWDIERTLEANAATLTLIGLGLAATMDRRWMALPMGVAAFLLQHAVQGWCPPVPVFRRLGFRTANEIDRERYALKALRGDFAGVKPAPDSEATAAAQQALQAAER